MMLLLRYTHDVSYTFYVCKRERYIAEVLSKVRNCPPNTKKALKKWPETPPTVGPRPPLQRPQNGQKSVKSRQKIDFQAPKVDFWPPPRIPRESPVRRPQDPESEKSQESGEIRDPSPARIYSAAIEHAFSAPECQTEYRYFSQPTITKNHLPKPSRTKKQSPN